MAWQVNNLLQTPQTTGMKKGNVIQLVLIIIALIIAFQTVYLLINAVATLLYAIGSGDYGNNLTPALTLFLIVLAQGTIAWLLISRSATIADSIYHKANADNSFKIVSRPQDILFILLIVCGFYFLLSDLPALLKALVNAFSTKAAGRFNMYEQVQPANWTLMLIKLLLPVVLLMFAKPIAVYFAKNMGDEPVSLEDGIDHIETTQE